MKNLWDKIAGIFSGRQEKAWAPIAILPGGNISISAADPALAISAVWACTRAIADPISFLPLHLYRRLSDGSRQRASDHPLYSILHDSPNPDQSALDFRHYLQISVLLHGNAYAEVVSRPLKFAL